jgi:hypothetical protein
MRVAADADDSVRIIPLCALTILWFIAASVALVRRVGRAVA